MLLECAINSRIYDRITNRIYCKFNRQRKHTDCELFTVATFSNGAFTRTFGDWCVNQFR